MEKIEESFLNKIVNLIIEARNKVKTSINWTMVYTYFDIGRMIVEEEQKGKERAKYGEYVIPQLSSYLTNKFGKGFSITNLMQMRKFYSIYSIDSIQQTLSDELKDLSVTVTGRRFFLSWSHYLQLMRIENLEVNHFYIMKQK